MASSVYSPSKSLTRLNSETPGYLEGQLIVATPQLTNSCFDKAVIYMCVHNVNGAMGVIVNQKVENVEFSDLLEQLKIESPGITTGLPIHFGGPIDTTRGFILHSDDYLNDEQLVHHNGIALTSSLHMLKDIADGNGPRQGLLTLGYAGWGAGQIEKEIEENSWITMPCRRDVIFASDNEAKWENAGRTLGLDIHRLSPFVGHA